MKHYISYSLLISSVILIFSCQVQYISTKTNAQNLNVNDSIAQPDPDLRSIYLPYKEILEKDMARIISVSEVEMIKNKPESFLTNFLADLLLEEGKTEAKQRKWAEPNISYFNYGGIRTSIPKGEITVGKIFELMPFENEMVMLCLTGQQVQDFMDIVASKGGDSVGGVRFSISGSKAENVYIENKPIDLQKKYWIITNDYTASGGDGLQIFTQRSEYLNTTRKIRDVIISYLEKKQQKGEKLQGKLDGRFKIN